MMTINIVMGAVMLATFVFAAWRISRRTSAAPRQTRAMQSRAQMFALAALAVMFALAAYGQHWLIAGGAAVAAASALIELNRKPLDSETIANWVYDRGRCGRCHYDLTYVDDPTTCPECGWVVPPPDTPAERADWAIWWKHWRIDHLENPGRKLAMMAFFTAAFLALAVWSVVFMNQIAVAGIAVVMTSQFAVNTFRIITCMRRTKEPAAPPDQPPRL